MTVNSKEIYLRDYQLPNFMINSVDLLFELNEKQTTVTSRMNLERNLQAERPGSPLCLHGENLKLISVKLNENCLTADDYQLDEQQLLFSDVPDKFNLEIVTQIDPQSNTSLSGLYKSNGNYCTQCEAEGFRRITYFMDRPDVMTVYTTTIIADKTRYPVLLSNGDLIHESDLTDNRHQVTWRDPFKKPSYLFALVAGDFASLQDQYTTMSGRKVALKIYAEHQQIEQCNHALQSLKNSMKWDEDSYGREYDLDTYMIVVISDFNMGAMENKGLNIFNSQCALADPQTATDADFVTVEAVIGHEYFHNWSGNRVTCRDWFQLSLKEGLTVFREQQFSAAMGSPTVHRIQNVKLLKERQFPQDAGPMAHPVRPDSYIEINNFYTMTVYYKGSEVIRMMHTILGEQGFRKGIDLYFQRHDGQAVTTEDFVAAMEDANDIDLTQFKRWYSQAGTPVCDVEQHYDAQAQQFTLTVKQSCPDTPGQTNKLAFHIPLSIGLLDGDGNDMDLGSQSSVLSLTQDKQQFIFENIKQKPTLSILRNFSAPVVINLQRDEQELLFLLENDNDEFNRWDAGQQLFINYVQQLMRQRQQGRELEISSQLSTVLASVLSDNSLDGSIQAQMLTLPSQSYLGELQQVIDVDTIHQAHQYLQLSLATALKQPLLDTYKKLHVNNNQLDKDAINARSLKNTCLSYLMKLNDVEIQQLCIEQLSQAQTMTDAIAAFKAIVANDCIDKQTIIDNFYQQWQNEPLVVNKWFSAQAMSYHYDTQSIRELLTHAGYDASNPNTVRSVIACYSQHNAVNFHHMDGQGYELLQQQIAHYNGINPQLAARLIEPFINWKRYDEARGRLMQQALQSLLSLEKLSSDLYEIITKSLGE